MKQKLPYRFRILIFLFFLIIITYFDRNCIALVGTQIKSEFDLNNEQFGWVLGSFSLAYALFEIPSGILGDRIGQHKVFIGKIVDVTHSFTIPLFILSGVLFFSCLCWLFIDAGKPLIKQDIDNFHIITVDEKNLVID
jgi:MFS family permease